MREIDLSKYTIRTDLISDTIGSKKDIKGLEILNDKVGNISIERVIVGEDASHILNRKTGTYVTIAFDDVTDNDNRVHLINVLTNEIKKFLESMNISKEMTVLVIGLGNSLSTPDALGPKTIDNIIVTKYIFDIDEVDRNSKYREASILKPGVYGTTGIETQAMVRGVINELHPDFAIIVDALASLSIDRVNKTIQISDTGISPGSGVGNTRKELSKETLGIPVISIGVPTVVDAVTIVSDTINFLIKKMGYSINNASKLSNKLKPVLNINYLEGNNEIKEDDKKNLLGILGDLSEDEMKALIFEVLTPVGYNLMVTPKEIDFIIDKLSLVISEAINKAIHDLK